MLLTGHSAPVSCSVLSPDGRMLATGSYDRTIVLWDTETGTMQRRLLGHRESVSHLAFSPDGSTLASVDWQKMRLWNPSNGRCERIFDGYFGPLTFTSEPGVLLAFGESEAVWLDTQTGRPMRRVPVSIDDSYLPPRVTVSRDGSTMATAIYSDFTTLYIRDVLTGELKCARRFPERVGWAVRDPLTGKRRIVYSNHRDSLKSFALSPDGRLLAVGGNSSLSLSNALTGKRTRLLIHSDSGPESLVFSDEGRVLASGFGDGSVKLWSIPSGELLRTLNGHTSWASTLAFSSDGSLLVSGSHDKTVRLWRSTTGECLKKLPALEYDVSIVVYSPHGRMIASAHTDGGIRLWEAATGRLLRTMACRHPYVNAVSFTNGGAALTSRSKPNLWSESAGAVELWSTETGRLEHSHVVRKRGSYPMPFSTSLPIRVAHEKELGSDRAVLVWEEETGQLRSRVKADIWAFSPDGRLLATTRSWEDRGKITLWDTATGVRIRELASPKTRDAVLALAFSPDGETVAGGLFGFRFALWDVQSGRFMWEAKTHADSISSVAFSPDGSLLAVGGDYDETVVLWDLCTRRRKLTLKGHSNNIRSVAFSPDGRKVVTGSQDGTARLWDADSGQLLVTLMVLPLLDDGVSEEWIAFTPDGYYDASPGAERFIRWNAGAAILDAEQLEGTFHRPRMVEEALR